MSQMNMLAFLVKLRIDFRTHGSFCIIEHLINKRQPTIRKTQFLPQITSIAYNAMYSKILTVRPSATSFS